MKSEKNGVKMLLRPPCYLAKRPFIKGIVVFIRTLQIVDMDIAIINKRFSPLRSATGFHAYQLALHLKNDGHKVQFITTVPKSTDIPKTEDALTRVWINSSYDGKNIVRRLLGDFIDALRLVRNAKSTGADHIIVMSDPPFLQLIASYFLVPANTSFWFMDIYPQAFVARGLISIKNPIYKWYLQRLRTFKPKNFLALGTNQAKYIQDQFGYSNEIWSPIGLQQLNLTGSAPRPYWYDGPDLIYLLYKGNLGSAHDAQFIVALVNQLDSTKFRLIVNASGAKAELLIRSIGEKKSVEIVEHLTDHDLAYTDVHIVTLLDKWTHICVPSKALLAISAGSALLYHGSDQSDTWEYIKSASWRISDEYDKNSEIVSFLSILTIEEIKKKKTKSVELYQQLADQLKQSYANYESKLR